MFMLKFSGCYVLVDWVHSGMV